MTLARLTCWIDPVRSDDFSEVCERRLVPVLERYGLSPSSDTGRTTVESAFTRLFAAEGPAAIAQARRGLSQDAAWREALLSLGPAFAGTADKAVQADIHLYRTPAGPGGTVSVGPGFRQGMWLSYSVQDHLPGGIVDILQARDGTLWMAAGHEENFSGVCRFDGLQLTTFTTQDGLPHNRVRALVEDRKGTLWFATSEGVSRYDGQQFDTFTHADGLADSSVLSLLEDRAGCLWFGTASGVSRFDGASWVTYTAAEGLADDRVGGILEDGEGHLWFTAGGGSGGRAGLTRFDGERFVSYTGRDGLSSSVLHVLTAVLHTAQGVEIPVAPAGFGGYRDEIASIWALEPPE